MAPSRPLVRVGNGRLPRPALRRLRDRSWQSLIRCLSVGRYAPDDRLFRLKFAPRFLWGANLAGLRDRWRLRRVY